MQNTQTLQPFTKIIKIKSINESYENTKPKSWVQKLSGLNNMSEEMLLQSLILAESREY